MNIEEFMNKDVYDNPRQVAMYVKEKGYQRADNSIRKDITAGKLVPRRKGGFSRRAIDQYIMSFLVKKVDQTHEPETTTTAGTTAPGLQEQKLKRQISGMEMKERREHFNFMRERGLYTEIVTIDRELADRWMSMRLFLSSWLVAEADTILDMLGGNHAKAEELIRLVDGDPLNSDKLSQHMFSRRAELVNLFRKGLEDALNKFGNGQWFTEDMREAWEEFERNREDISLEAAEDVLDAFGTVAGLDTMEELLAKYWIIPKEAA